MLTVQIIENPADYTFIKTCECCPEQYEVFDRYGKHVGYVRYRYGKLSCTYPDVGGHVTFECTIGDKFDGCFANDEERQHYLDAIAKSLDAIIRYEQVDEETED